MKLSKLVLTLGCATAMSSGCIIVTDGESGTDTDATSSTTSSSTSSTSSDSDSATATAGSTSEGTSASSTSGSTSASSSTSATSGSTSVGTSGGASGCGWGDTGIQDPAMGYICGGAGEDPEGQYALECPDGLNAGDDCGEVTGVGCCDANGDLWYCDANAMLYMESCGG